MPLENSSFVAISSASTGFIEQITHMLRILCYNGRLTTWTVVSLTKAKFKPLMFSIPGFAFTYTANMFILMILYDFRLSLEQSCYIIVYIRKAESCVRIAERCAARTISNGAENLVLLIHGLLDLYICSLRGRCLVTGLDDKVCSNFPQVY
jgi:hypothetical protein